MSTTLELAAEALRQGELPIAAIVVLDDEVVAQAHTSEVADGRSLVHAELKALVEFDSLHPSIEERRRSALFTNLEPCLMCLGACQSCFIGHVYYGLQSWIDGAAETAARLGQEHRGYPGQRWPAISGGVMSVESKALFVEYVGSHTFGARWRWAKALIDGQLD